MRDLRLLLPSVTEYPIEQKEVFQIRIRSRKKKRDVDIMFSKECRSAYSRL